MPYMFKTLAICLELISSAAALLQILESTLGAEIAANEQLPNQQAPRCEVLRKQILH